MGRAAVLCVLRAKEEGGDIGYSYDGYWFIGGTQMYGDIKEASRSHQDESENFLGTCRGTEGKATRHYQCLEKTSG